jgi:hypothetical protein
MAWSKIDEDRAAEGESWSAFLLKGLTDNANAYADELAPGFAAVWGYETAPQWASLETFTGGWVVFNCGSRATQVQFTGWMQHHATLSGYVRVFHPASGCYADATIAGGDASFTVTVIFNTPQSGPQEFQVLYKSSMAEESLGHFHCFTAIGNQIAVRNDGNIFTVAANAGRQFWAVQLAGSNVDDGQPIPPGGFHLYQVGRVNPLANAGGGQHADGYLITFPDVETNPPILRSTSTFIQQAPNYVQGDIFELSWIKLRGVGFKVTGNAASTVPMVYAHDLAQSVGMLPRAQRNFAGNQLIQVAASASKDSGFIGCLVGPEAPLTKFYASDENRTVTLSMRMRALTYLPAAGTPEITISVAEVVAGGGITNILTQNLGIVPVPLMRGRRAFSERDFVNLALNGVFLGADEWGLADSALSTDLTTALTITATLTFPVSKVASGAIYAIQVDSTVPFYVSGFYLGGS